MANAINSEQMNLASATVKASDYVKLRGLRMVSSSSFRSLTYRSFETDCVVICELKYFPCRTRFMKRPT
jgi:hypothetical protein